MNSWFPIWIGILDLPPLEDKKRQLQVINVHLRPPVEPNGGANLWTASKTNPFRLKELQNLAATLDTFVEAGKGDTTGTTTLPTIITGDFNEGGTPLARTTLTTCTTQMTLPQASLG